MTELRSTRRMWTTRALLTSGLLVAGIGCQTAQPGDRSENIPTGKQSPTASAGNLITEQTPPPAEQILDTTKRYRAQKIYLKALDVFEQKEYDLAYQEFGRALDVDPNYHLAWHKKGLCAYYKLRYELEIDCYRRCLEIQPDFMEGLQSLGAAYLTLDHLERAVPIYRRMLVLEPKNPVALFNIAICYHDLQDYPAAIEHIRRFIDAYPKDPSRPKADELLQKARQKAEKAENRDLDQR